MYHGKSLQTLTAGAPGRSRRTIGSVLAALVMLTSVFVAAPARATDQGSLPDSLAINFQPANKEVPTGFQPDAGQPYSAQRGYGWTLTDGKDRQCVDRHFAANQELDTYCHATSYYWDVDGFWTPHDSPATWRADLLPGTYDVTVVVGDPMKRTPGIAHSVQVEGVTFFDREPTSDSMTWARTTKRVTVDDSSLDVSFAGGDLTKIVSIKAQRVGTTETPRTTTTQAPTTTEANGGFSLRVNFQPAGTPVPPGFVADSGRAITNGAGFGWALPDGSTRQCGDRDAVADQQVDTFCHATTRYLNQGGRWIAIDSPAAWKALVPNGRYDVTVTVGESRYQYSSIAHSTQVEGVSFHDRVVTTDSNPTSSATRRVTVADGALDLTFDGGTKTKIVSVTIVSAGESSTTTAPTTTTTTAPTTTTTTAPTTTTTTAPTTTTTTAPPNPQPSPPVIDVWGGDSISVGSRGVPQRFVNVLGNVSDNGTVVNLTAQLEGDVARSMRIGPAERRLVNQGDFNIDIPIVELHPGINRVTLVATDDDGLTTTRVVTINYDPVSVRPNMTIDWTELDSIDEAAHVVDGKWRITNDGIRTVEPGYDRIVSVGHITWESYEILTSFTLHGITDNHLDSPSNGAGVGILAHWTGHSMNPGGENPLVGFLPDDQGFVPLGAVAWLRWTPALTTTAEMLDHWISPKQSTRYQISNGETHLIRMQVLGGDVTTYRWRVWRVDTPEPTGWQQFTTGGGEPAPHNGSIALIAHEADVTFGTVSITPFG